MVLPDNVLFEGGAGDTIRKKLWIYDLCANQYFTLKTSPLRREHLAESGGRT